MSARVVWINIKDPCRTIGLLCSKPNSIAMNVVYLSIIWFEVYAL